MPLFLAVAILKGEREWKGNRRGKEEEEAGGRRKKNEERLIPPPSPALLLLLSFSLSLFGMNI